MIFHKYKLIIFLFIVLVLVGISYIIKLPKVQTKTETYSSPLEKLTFTYPSSWSGTKDQLQNPENGLYADAFTLLSPSGKIKISWAAAISGLGGGCDSTTTIGPNNNGCGQFEVIEKDKIPNTNLDYVEWIYTMDGINYTPRFAVANDNPNQPNKSRSYLFISVFTFQGKNNYMKQSDGSVTGPFLAVLSGGDIFQKDNKYFPVGTKEEAIKFFSDSEMLQAKQILLSVRY